jgi:hypothetical protein
MSATGRKPPSARFIDERSTANVADFEPAIPLPAKASNPAVQRSANRGRAAVASAVIRPDSRHSSPRTLPPRQNRRAAAPGHLNALVSSVIMRGKSH